MTGEIVTAALLNEQVKDNGLLTAPAIMTTAGDIMYASAANTPARLAKSTTSTQYLANTGTSNVPQWNEVALTTGVSGTLPVANGGTGITSLGSGVATFMGTPSSANLRGALTDETGTGAAVFATSPTLVTPALGTPASGVLTNATGLPIAGIANGTDGELITWNASGVAAAVAVGSADQVLTSNGAGAAPTFQDAGGEAAYARVGGNITEASSVSTSAVDLFSVASLTIAVATSIDVNFNARKSSGATDDVGVGCKINSTVVGEANAAGGMGWRCSTFDVAQSGGSHYWIHSRTNSSYMTSSGGEYNAFTQASGGNRAAGQVTNLNGDGIFPNAVITDIIQRAITDNASNTVAADDLQVYTKTVA